MAFWNSKCIPSIHVLTETDFLTEPSNDTGFHFTEATLTLSQQTVIHIHISLTLYCRHHSLTMDGSQTHQPFFIVRGLRQPSTSALAQRH